MKKYLFFSIFIVGLIALSFGFAEGGFLMYGSVVAYPFGPADVQTPAFAATLAVSITNQMTILEPGTMTGAMTINLTIDSGVRAGARIALKATSDTTGRDITFGTGFSSPVLSGTASKTKTQTFVYDGTAFLPDGAALQIN